MAGEEEIVDKLKTLFQHLFGDTEHNGTDWVPLFRPKYFQYSTKRFGKKFMFFYIFVQILHKFPVLPKIRKNFILREDEFTFLPMTIYELTLTKISGKHCLQ
jgi:hypothetical protein